MQLALVCGGLAFATWGCGFVDMVFNGEDSQTMREEAARGLWDAELVAEYFSMLEQQRLVA